MRPCAVAGKARQAEVRERCISETPARGSCEGEAGIERRPAEARRVRRERRPSGRGRRAKTGREREEREKTGREREEREKTGRGQAGLRHHTLVFSLLSSLLSSLRGQAGLSHHTLVPEMAYLRRRDSAQRQPPTVSLFSLSLSLCIYTCVGEAAGKGKDKGCGRYRRCLVLLHPRKRE